MIRKFVELGPRDSGTPGAEQAAIYLRDRLRELGVAAEIQEFTDLTPVGELTFRNVLGRIPGTGGKILLLGSHYDTKPGIAGFVGANDSGSRAIAITTTPRSLRRRSGGLVGRRLLLVLRLALLRLLRAGPSSLYYPHRAPSLACRLKPLVSAKTVLQATGHRREWIRTLLTGGHAETPLTFVRRTG